jgi:ribosomal protein S18 acetylase RimI-like enzyme
VTACFAAVEQGREVLAGYYTVASSSVPLTDLPEQVTKKLPRYPSVPAARLGSLAVDRQFRGRGLGDAMLADPLERSVAEIAAYALVVDAKDEQAAALYRHHGFLAFNDNQLALLLPLATAQGLLQRR